MQDARCKTCSVEDCEREVRARGWCSMHWKRWRAHGDPLRGGRPAMNAIACEVCVAPATHKGYCCAHYHKWRTYGDPLAGGTQAPKGSGSDSNGYRARMENGVLKREHNRIAERALGHALPPGAEVHHVNENKSDNTPTNLVICPSHAYHELLHQRMRAFAACGHYDWLKCWICKQYDAPESLRLNVSRNKGQHGECRRRYEATGQGRAKT